MAISQSTFAQALRKLRPALVLTAKRMRRCRHEDAEDLASRVVVVALQRLDDFQEATGEAGLRRWLNAILHHVVMSDYQKEARSAQIEPLEGAVDLSADESGYDPTFEAVLDCLLPEDRKIVAAWLAGYRNREIAAGLRLHRNTVGHRLSRAFETIRARYDDPEALEQACALFAACARRTIYRKPAASWRPWRDRHPPERRFERRRQRPPNQAK